MNCPQTLSPPSTYRTHLMYNQTKTTTTHKPLVYNLEQLGIVALCKSLQKIKVMAMKVEPNQTYRVCTCVHAYNTMFQRVQDNRVPLSNFNFGDKLNDNDLQLTSWISTLHVAFQIK